MSEKTTLTRRESYPVRIGALLMQCERFKAVGVRSFAEKATVSGDTVFSNTDKKAIRLTFEGRIYDEYIPLRPLLYTDSFMRADGSCQIEYRGLKFTNCQAQSYTVEDKSEDYIYASITLVTVDEVSQTEAIQNDG